MRNKMLNSLIVFLIAIPLIIIFPIDFCRNIMLVYGQRPGQFPAQRQGLRHDPIENAFRTLMKGNNELKERVRIIEEKLGISNKEDAYTADTELMGRDDKQGRGMSGGTDIDSIDLGKLPGPIANAFRGLIKEQNDLKERIGKIEESLDSDHPDEADISTPLPTDTSALPKSNEGNLPFTNFIMIHFEVGGDSNYGVYKDIIKKELKKGYKIDNKSLAYQKALWPTAKKLVELADSYNFRLTLAMNPQWAEYILQDDEKVEDVKKWINNGHELAFHHHGIDHLDWNGYTNRSADRLEPSEQRFANKLKSDYYRGSANEGFNWLKKLASKIDPSYKIITGNITDTAIDKPEEIYLLTRGNDNFNDEFLSKPVRMKLPNAQKIFWVNHYWFRSNFNTAREQNLYDDKQNFEKSEVELENIKKNYVNAIHNQIVGIVFHVFDYYRVPKVYESFFKYLDSKDQEVITIRDLITRYNDKFTIEEIKRK